MWFATAKVKALARRAIQRRNPLTGLCGLQPDGWPLDRCPETLARRNPLTGLCGLQQRTRVVKTPPPNRPVAIPLRGYVVCNWSFLSVSGRSPLGVAIPLRGYVVCNPLQQGGRRGVGDLCRNPLTGLCGLQQVGATEARGVGESQSPYGAMWFATASSLPLPQEQ